MGDLRICAESTQENSLEGLVIKSVRKWDFFESLFILNLLINLITSTQLRSL